MLFWFAAWVAVAAHWGDISCGSNGGPCGAGTAAIVFGAILWLVLSTTYIATFSNKGIGSRSSELRSWRLYISAILHAKTRRLRQKCKRRGSKFLYAA
jgi:hypothetical protein